MTNSRVKKIYMILIQEPSPSPLSKLQNKFLQNCKYKKVASEIQQHH